MTDLNEEENGSGEGIRKVMSTIREVGGGGGRSRGKSNRHWTRREGENKRRKAKGKRGEMKQEWKRKRREEKKTE